MSFSITAELMVLPRVSHGSNSVKKRVGLSRLQANRLRQISVLLNVVGFFFFIADHLVICASIKIVAELLRIPFFEHTRAHDMTGLSVFFITGSVVAIVLRLR